MGIFDFLKKKKRNTKYTIEFEESSVFGSDSSEDLEDLTAENKLPWGWISQNKEFTERISGEYSYFLDLWLDARKKSPKELYSALKSFVVYLEATEKLCVSMGEYFEIWFHELIASKDYIEKRRNELNHLVDNFDELSYKFDEQQLINERKQDLLPAVIELLKANDGLLQSEFKQLFDEPFQDDVGFILYQLHKEGKLERIKEGRTYILHYRG